jgi:hypothetical protein
VLSYKNLALVSLFPSIPFCAILAALDRSIRASTDIARRMFA